MTAFEDTVQFPYHIGFYNCFTSNKYLRLN